MNFYKILSTIWNRLLTILKSKPSEQEKERERKFDIDWEFIKELEGFEINGYVPDESGERTNNILSGVTIASGFDLGQHSKEEIMALPLAGYLQKQLSRYAGLRGKEAKDALKRTPLRLTEVEADLINVAVKTEKAKELASAYNASSELDFYELPRAMQTVIMSVGFQYGNLRTRTPNFWRMVTQGNWHKTVSNLENFRDSFKTRRRKEAKLLRDYLKSVE